MVRSAVKKKQNVKNGDWFQTQFASNPQHFNYEARSLTNRLLSFVIPLRIREEVFLVFLVIRLNSKNRLAGKTILWKRILRSPIRRARNREEEERDGEEEKDKEEDKDKDDVEEDDDDENDDDENDDDEYDDD